MNFLFKIFLFSCLASINKSKLTQKRKREKSLESAGSVVGSMIFSSQRYRSQCHLIPGELGLCYGIEYKTMRLPNLLGHVTMEEVMNQASPWPPLVSNGCHSETRKFLCTLYAPVCMEGYASTIPPCRSLCEAVRGACSPTMNMFGYSWPEMFNCSKFPESLDTDELCIPGGESIKRPEPKPCLPCRHRSTSSILHKMCSFDFVMKVRVKRLEFDQGGTRILIQQKSKKVYKWSGPVPRHWSLWLQDGLHCTCNVIKSVRRKYLVAGWQVGKNLILQSVSKWGKRNGKILKKLRNRRKCEIM